MTTESSVVIPVNHITYVAMGFPLSASGSLPSGVTSDTSMLSTLPDLQGILGPPIALMASAPANVYRSAYVRSVFLLNYHSERRR